MITSEYIRLSQTTDGKWILHFVESMEFSVTITIQLTPIGQEIVYIAEYWKDEKSTIFLSQEVWNQTFDELEASDGIDEANRQMSEIANPNTSKMDINDAIKIRDDLLMRWNLIQNIVTPLMTTIG